MFLKNKIFIYASANDPFYHSNFVSLGGIDYLIGALFFLLAIIALTFIPRANRKFKEYKAAQLKTYNKNRPREIDVTNYEKTTLYPPLGLKIKHAAPILIAIVFVVIAITFMTGRPIQTL